MYFSECTEAVALLAIPGLLREDTNLFICSMEQHRDSEETSGSPVIVYNGQDPYKATNFDIYADGIKILSTKSIVKAFAIMIGCFFVLNIAYPKKMIKTLTFLQKVILGLQDSIKKVNAVVTLLTNLNRK